MVSKTRSSIEWSVGLWGGQRSRSCLHVGASGSIRGPACLGTRRNGISRPSSQPEE